MAKFALLPSGKIRVEIRKRGIFLKTKTFSTQDEADLWAADYQKKVEKILSLTPKKLSKLTPEKIDSLGGPDLFKKLGVTLEIITFLDVVNEYMQQWTGKDPSHHIRLKQLTDEFGNVPINSIKTKYLRQFLKDYANGSKLRGGLTVVKTDQKRSPNSVVRLKAAASSIFKFAIQEGYIKENPVTGIFLKSAPNQIVRYLSEDELARLLIACKESAWNKLYLLILLAITTGMRKSELMNLGWSDIDFDKSLALLSDTKNGEPRRNPIPSPAMCELKKFRTVGNSLIFASTIKPDRPFEFRQHWLKALEQAKVEHFRFHDLRHSAASYLVMNGATLHETAEILGHKSTETTKRYAHLSTEHKSKLAERVMSEVFND